MSYVYCLTILFLMSVGPCTVWAMDPGETERSHSIEDVSVKNDVDIHYRDDRGRTLLMIAAEQGHVDDVLALIHAGADVQDKDDAKLTALMVAAENGHAEVVKILIASGADVNERSWRRTGSGRLATQFFPSHGSTALMMAVKSRNPEIVQDLIKAGAKVNVDSLDIRYANPLIMAAEQGDAQIVRILLESGAKMYWSDIDRMGGLNKYSYDSVMTLAIKSGHTEVVNVLLEKGFKLSYVSDYCGSTPLVCAALHGQYDILIRLLDAGADINAEAQINNQHQPKTPLMAASWTNRMDIVDALLARGADPNIESGNRRSALMDAAGAGNLDIVDRLLKAGAKLEVCDNWHKTALLLACESRNPNHLQTAATVERLLLYGANCNAQDVYGESALIKAATRGRMDIIRLLLRMDVNVNLTTYDRMSCCGSSKPRDHCTGALVPGQTASMKAVASGYQEIAEFLQEKEEKQG